MTSTPSPPPTEPRTAVITGASQGLGLALARVLAAQGWSLVIDARTEADLDRAAAQLRGDGATEVVTLPGDVADDDHRDALVQAVERKGRLDVLVHNASDLGAPLGPVAELPLDRFRRVYEVNVVAPLALTQRLLPALAASDRPGRIIAVTSDAAVKPYPGWGGYGSSKAALEHLTRILAEEQPDLRVHVVDPGDMRTRMHQEAFPDEDISDRSPPEAAVPGLLALIEDDHPSGRYQARDLPPEKTETTEKTL